MDGYRVIITTYRFIPDKKSAKELALKERGQGKRTEIITEREYQESSMSREPMQDLSQY
jgi:hypothetical protein